MCEFRAAFWFTCVLSLLSVEAGLVQKTQARTPANQTNQDAGATTRIRFENTGMGEMKDPDGVHLGFANFKGSDGSILTVLYEIFGDSAAAQAYFEKQVQKAVKLVERNKKLDSVGRAVGDRAEILIRVSGGKEIPAVLWTDGARFHEIYSPSRKSMLDLEKVYKY